MVESVVFGQFRQIENKSDKFRQIGQSHCYILASPTLHDVMLEILSGYRGRHPLRISVSY